jgi:sensor histidine kinase regulating citrate/malate metabolism
VLALRGKLPLDPQELITVVGNLIDNGLDAAASSERPERWVRVSVRVEDEELVVRVRDSGPGVHPAHAARVFEDGFSTKDRRRHRGHGLGLALVREVVDQHGGEIGVRNDGGAVFTVRLPMVGMVGKR